MSEQAKLLSLEIYRDARGHWVRANFHKATGEQLQGPFATLAETMARLARFTVDAAEGAKAAGL
jgi:hypothetical protein